MIGHSVNGLFSEERIMIERVIALVIAKQMQTDILCFDVSTFSTSQIQSWIGIGINQGICYETFFALYSLWPTCNIFPIFRPIDVLLRKWILSFMRNIFNCLLTRKK